MTMLYHLKISLVVLLVSFVCISNGQQYSQTVIGNVTIQWANRGTKTDFIVTLKPPTTLNINDAWLAVGINTAPRMASANAMVCRNNPLYPSVLHYLNSMNYTSNIMNSNNPSMGLGNGLVANIQGNLTCLFSRDNSNSFPGYYSVNISSNYYIITAYGPGGISYHGSNRAASNSASIFTLSPTSTVSTTTTTTRLTTPPTTQSTTRTSTSTTTTRSTTTTTTTTTRTTTTTPTTTTRTSTSTTTTRTTTTTTTTTTTSTTTTRTTTTTPITTTRTSTSTTTTRTTTTTPTTTTRTSSSTTTTRTTTITTSTTRTTTTSPITTTRTSISTTTIRTTISTSLPITTRTSILSSTTTRTTTLTTATFSISISTITTSTPVSTTSSSKYFPPIGQWVSSIIGWLYNL